MSDILSPDLIQPLDVLKEFRVRDVLESGLRDQLMQALAAKAVVAAKGTSEASVPLFRTKPPFEEYATFDLRLIRVLLPDGKEKLVVEGSGEAGEAREVIDMPATTTGPTGVAKVGSARHLVPPAPTEGQPTSADAMRDWKKKIANWLMPPPVKSRYDACKALAEDRNRGLRIRIFTYDPDIAAVAWEAAFLDDECLCLKPQTPVVRYVLASTQPRRIAVGRPLRVLGIISKRPDLALLNAEAEKQAIEEAVAPLKQGGLLELDWLPAANTMELLQAMLRQYHVVHYIGHGAYDPTKGHGTLAFEKSIPGAEELSALQFFRNLGPRVGFVFLNACDSGHEVGGIAEELVRRGVPAVLGMRRSVLDNAAVQFARMFYRTLADGWPVDAALVAGRLAMIAILGDDDTNDQWILPILYMRAPDGRIFE